MMMKNLLTIWLIMTSIFLMKAQKIKKNVTSFYVGESSFCAVKAPDSRFYGLYKYPGKEARLFQYEQGEPIVDLGIDQKGRFQNHGSAALPVTWWLGADCLGNLDITKGVLADRYILVVRFEEGGSNGYPAKGSYNRMILDVYKDSNKIVILGEREKE